MNNKEIPFNNKYIQSNIVKLLSNYSTSDVMSYFRFCSDDYVDFNSEYSFDGDMTERRVQKLINANMLRTRVSKSKDIQKRRTTEKAEVFTPRWVCEYQVNQCIVGETGLTKEELANRVNEYIFNKEWTEEEYYSYLNKTWLESCCGEAPYVVSRYDTVSGEDIAVKNRIGFLDRKLQLIGRYQTSFDKWFCDVLKAYRSVYAYEWQGDNLFIARCNLLMTFVDYYEEYFGKSIEELSDDDIKSAIDYCNSVRKMERMKDYSVDGIITKIVLIITKNTTQMDGLTWKKPGTDEDAYFFDWAINAYGNSAYIPYAKVFGKAKEKEEKARIKAEKERAKAERLANGNADLFDLFG